MRLRQAAKQPSDLDLGHVVGCPEIGRKLRALLDRQPSYIDEFCHDPVHIGNE
jgi:hypothetical protein